MKKIFFIGFLGAIFACKQNSSDSPVNDRMKKILDSSGYEADTTKINSHFADVKNNTKITDNLYNYGGKNKK